MLNTMIRYYLNQYLVSKIIEELLDEINVDNWLSGADTVLEATYRIKEAHDILCAANKWIASKFSVTRG